MKDSEKKRLEEFGDENGFKVTNYYQVKDLRLLLNFSLAMTTIFGVLFVALVLSVGVAA